MPAATETVQVTQTLDAKGLNCPLPILKAKKAISGLDAGDVLQVVSTDPGSVCDMAAFAEQTGNQLIEQGSDNNKFFFLLKKA